LYELQKHDISYFNRMHKFLQKRILYSVLFIVWVLLVIYLLAFLWFWKEPPQKELTFSPLEACLKAAEENRASRWAKGCKPMNERLTRQIAECKDPGAREHLSGKACMGATCRNAGGLLGLDRDVAQTIDVRYEEDRNTCLKRYPMDAGHEF
jgi:hypothetical protein